MSEKDYNNLSASVWRKVKYSIYPIYFNSKYRLNKVTNLVSITKGFNFFFFFWLPCKTFYYFTGISKVK